MAKETFLFPVIYKGNKDRKEITVPGTPDPVIFMGGPDFDVPYAYVTEIQGRYLRRISPELFDFPNGLMVKSDSDALVARVDELEATVARLVAQLGDIITGEKRTRTPRVSRETPTLAAEMVAN